MTQRERPGLAWVVTAIQLVGAAAAWRACILLWPHAPSSRGLPWVVIAVGLATSLLLYVDFIVRRHAIAADFRAVALVAGMAYLSPQALLVAVLVASPAFVYYNRGNLIKVAFNASNAALASAVFELVYRTALGSASPSNLRGWLAIVIAMVVWELMTTGPVVVVVGLTSGEVTSTTLVGSALHVVLNTPLHVVLSITAVSMIWLEPLAGSLLVSVLAGSAVLAYRAYQALRARHNRLDTLYDYTRGLSEMSERTAVMVATLSQAAELLKATRAELVVVEPNNTVRYRLDADGELVEERRSKLGALETLALTSGPVLANRQNKSNQVIAGLVERSSADAVAVALPSGSGHEVLVVSDRPGDRDTFDDADLDLLRTLAAHSGVAIRNSRLVEQLKGEVVAREHESLHDSLTGLANRVLFLRWTASALAARPADSLLATMIIDLDGFKEINDTLGHLTGDSILTEVAHRLADEVKGEAFAARLGGDEFAIVVPAASDVNVVVDLAERILGRIAEPVSSDGLALSTRASIGVALAPDHGTETSTLLKCADVAMYQAKADGGGVVVYERASDPHTTRRLSLASELRQALIDESLAIHFQPKADMLTGRIVGFEALLRWQHPEYGNVTPEEFVPVAEHAGLIGPLTSWVLQGSLRQLRHWHDLGFCIDIAVNLSARNLIDSSLVSDLAETLRRTGVDAQHLTLELTESSIMADPDRSERALAAITSLGVRMAMDDFGTGYSSLSRLVRLPMSEIKIDKSFVLQLADSKVAQTIVRTTIDMATSLGYLVTAEGVEDVATWDVLARLGAHCAQGYLLARPMSGPDSERWLAEYRPAQPVIAVAAAAAAPIPHPTP